MIRLTSSELYPIPLPEGHTFPMEKYSLVRQQLEYEGLIVPEQIIHSPLLEEAAVLTTHSAEYWRRIRDCGFDEKEIRKIGFPATEALRDRSLSSAKGTLISARNALQYGVGINLAGGTHHAYREYGEGYCVLNDLAIAAHCLLEENAVRRILIVDLDVHQGNGTAALFRNNDRVFTFSMHGKDNYPLKKEKSDRDIELPTGTGDSVYLALLRQHLPELIQTHRPDILFYQSGVDVLENDRLGKLSLTPEGCKERDYYVFHTARTLDLPIVSVMGGGYHTSLQSLIQAHTETVRQAFLCFN